MIQSITFALTIHTMHSCYATKQLCRTLPEVTEGQWKVLLWKMHLCSPAQ